MKRLLQVLGILFALLVLYRTPALADNSIIFANSERPAAWLEELSFRPSPLILPPSPHLETRINSTLTIGLAEPLRSGDEIVVSTAVITGREKWELPVSGIVRADGVECDLHETEIVCRGGDKLAVALQMPVVIQYEAAVTACPADGLIQQVAYYDIGDQTGNLMIGWYEVGTLKCENLLGSPYIEDVAATATEQAFVAEEVPICLEQRRLEKEARGASFQHVNESGSVCEPVGRPPA